MRRILPVVAVVLLVAVLAPALAAACPLCKEAASDADKPGATSVWRGMYWSILFMVAAPFAMVGTMIVLIRRTRRRQPSRLAQASAFPGAHGGRP
ncbi:MAG: hypothetical protein ABI968_01965 [Acidobacteriota bacterium]